MAYINKGGFNNYLKVYNTPEEEHIEGKVTFSDLKPGNYIFYYDRYKIHKFKIVSAQIEDEVRQYKSQYQEQTTIRKKFIIRAEDGSEYDFDPDMAKMYDSYQFHKPVFATYTAAQEYLDGRIEFCQGKIADAQATIDKYNKLKEQYEQCRLQMAVDLTVDIYKMSTFCI